MTANVGLLMPRDVLLWLGCRCIKCNICCISQKTESLSSQCIGKRCILRLIYTSALHPQISGTLKINVATQWHTNNCKVGQKCTVWQIETHCTLTTIVLHPVFHMQILPLYTLYILGYSASKSRVSSAASNAPAAAMGNNSFSRALSSKGQRTSHDMVCIYNHIQIYLHSSTTLILIRLISPDTPKWIMSPQVINNLKYLIGKPWPCQAEMTQKIYPIDDTLLQNFDGLDASPMVNSAATLRRQQELQQQQYAIQQDARQQQMQQHTEGNHGAKHAPIKEESHQEGARVRKGWFLKTSIPS